MAIGSLPLNPGVGGSNLPTYVDALGNRWVAGLTGYLVSTGTPDTLAAVTPTNGLPIVPATGATFALAAGSTVELGATSLAALESITIGTALPTGTNDIGKVDATGTKVTAATIPTGGVGFLGWLSAIWYQLTQILTFKIDQTTPGTTNLVAAGLVAGETHIGQVGGHTATPSANFTRPADTTAYAVGDIVANSTTAGSVVPMSFANAARVAAGSGVVRRARVKKNGTTITNGGFRVHLYSTLPTVASGDNAAWSTSEASYLGSLDVTLDRVFTDASKGIGTPTTGGEVAFKLVSGTTIYGILEARAAYTPISAEVFTVDLEISQD